MTAADNIRREQILHGSDYPVIEEDTFETENNTEIDTEVTFDPTDLDDMALKLGIIHS